MSKRPEHLAPPEVVGYKSIILFLFIFIYFCLYGINSSLRNNIWHNYYVTT